MQDEKKSDSYLLTSISQLLNLVSFLVFVIALLSAALIWDWPALLSTTGNSSGKGEKKTSSHLLVGSSEVFNEDLWTAPSVMELEECAEKELILYGKELIMHTSNYFGPSGKVIKGSTNGMNCQNCHLDAGTRPFGNNYSAVASTYPKYRARSGTIEGIEKRVNDCFERSLNGHALDDSSVEMSAIRAYILWLGKDVQVGVKPKGAGFKDIVYLDRPADPVAGEKVYIQQCQSCHMKNGEGQFSEEKSSFKYPALWGEHSYNTGAGLYRISPNSLDTTCHWELHTGMHC